MRSLTSVSVIADVDAPVTLLSLNRYLRERHNLRLQLHRARFTSTNSFNLNSFSDGQCLTDFRFLKSDIGKISVLSGWKTGLTRHNKYRCDPITAICILLRRIASPCRWIGTEEKILCIHQRCANCFGK